MQGLVASKHDCREADRGKSLRRADRGRQAAPGGAHDRLLRRLTIALPILVVLIAAVMILAPLAHRKEVSLILDRAKVATTDQRIAVSKAVYKGRDNRGRTFAVAAGQAVQLSSNKPVLELAGLAAAMQIDDGTAVVTAPRGAYDFGIGMLRVPGVVNVQAPGGYRLALSRVDVDLRARRLAAQGGIEGRLPTGTFSADEVTVDLETRTITLRGHARLRMEPGRIQLPKW